MASDSNKVKGRPNGGSKQVAASSLSLRQRKLSSKDDDIAKILVIYTGGTIGMVSEPIGYVPKPNCLVRKLHEDSLFDNDEAKKDLRSDDERDEYLMLQNSRNNKPVKYKVVEFDPLLDSSNMSISDWIKIAKCIEANYTAYDGFVVLHGTDTMAYTASALSFMCENLGKPIILTGSQIPIFETRSDGRDNFLSSLIIASSYCIPEVLICFSEKVYRGNRCMKGDSGSFAAFYSPNVPPLVTLEIEIKVDWDDVFRACTTEKFKIHTSMCANVALLRLFPGISSQTVRAFLQPPVQGVVLQTYGAGNAPSNREDIMSILREACNWGVLIINISQCIKGSVGTLYATGTALMETGVILGGDMTPEAALTKLSFVLGKDEWSLEMKKKMLGRSLRGEMTIVKNQAVSIGDSELIETFARFMSLSTIEEVVSVKSAIYPSLMCAAAKSCDIPALEKLRATGGNLDAVNHDGRTPLHVACNQGHMTCVQYLLSYGVSVHKKDNRGESPLVDAIEGGHLDVIKLLRQTGAYLTLPSFQVAIRMCSAVAQDDKKSLDAWLAAGADPDNSDYDNRTPLHVAVSLNKKDFAKLLIDNGADPELEDTFGLSGRIIAENLGFPDLQAFIGEDKLLAGSNTQD